MERMSEEKKRDETRTGSHASANRLGGGRKWDGSGASVNVKEEEERGVEGCVCVCVCAGGIFSYSCSVGSALRKRQQKTTAAGARPGRHERRE